MLSIISRMLSGGLADQLRRAYEAKLNAANDNDRIAAEQDIARISAAVDMARVASGDRWGATSLGRYLIVLPYGLWWAAVHLDSIINAQWYVLALPPQIDGMAQVLIPAIILADGAALVARRWR